MSENKFTPGPWFVVNEYIYRRPKEDLYEYGGGVAGDKPLAVIMKGWYGEDVSGYPIEANANLIAAAPELLEALEDAIEQIYDNPILERKIEKAIAKAKGLDQ